MNSDLPFKRAFNEEEDDDLYMSGDEKPCGKSGGKNRGTVRHDNSLGVLTKKFVTLV
jgi:hypothetical protein